MVHQVWHHATGVGTRLLTATRQVRALRCQPLRRFVYWLGPPVLNRRKRIETRKRLHARITDAGYEPVNRNWS